MSQGPGNAGPQGWFSLQPKNTEDRLAKGPVLDGYCIREGCGKKTDDESGYCSDVCFHEDWHLDPVEIAPAEEGKDYGFDLPWEMGL